MNHIEAYMNSNPQIGAAAIFCGYTFEEDKILGLLSQSKLQKLYFVGYFPMPTGKAFVESIKEHAKEDGLNVPDFFEFKTVDAFLLENLKNWALIFYNLENKNEIIPFVQQKPVTVIGSLWEKDYGAYCIWDSFRKIAEHIQIETLRTDAPPQILSWDKKENPIELSVIFPMYNVANYLEQCIKTVTARNDDWIEFLFVNDGSPDNCREIVLEWAKKDGRIKLLDKENGGCASARQFGLDRALGKYVGFIDPDDFVEEDFFFKLFRAAMTGCYEVSYCGYKEFYEDTKKTKNVADLLDWRYQKGTQDVHLLRDLMGYSPIGIWRRIYSKEMLDKFGIHFYTDLRRFDDLPFKVEVFANARSVIAIPEYLYNYRLSRAGQDVSADDERLFVHFDIFDYLEKSIAEKHDAELTDWLQVVKVMTHRWALDKIKRQFAKEYCKRAIKDLRRTGSFFHTRKLLKARMGKSAAKSYVKMVVFHK